MKDEPNVFLVTACREAEREIRGRIESLGRPLEVFRSPGELLAVLEPGSEGCVVLDVRSPWDPARTTCVDSSHPTQIRLPIVFVTGSRRPARGGGSNVVEIPDGGQALEGLEDAVEAALEEDARGRAEQRRGVVIADRLRSLTRREREVMAMVVDGLSNRRIADRFGISSRTVEIHRARVMEKMDAGSLSELVRMACLRGVQITGPAEAGSVVYRVTPDAKRQRKA